MLTDRQVQALKAPAEGRLEIPDGESGVVVRVSPKGRKTLGTWFRVPQKFGPDGARGFFTFGTYPATTLASAREQARKVRELTDKGLDPRVELDRAIEDRLEAERQALVAAEKAEEARKKLTVAALCQRHLDARNAVLKPSTKEQLAWVLAIVKGLPFADRLLTEVGRGEVKEELRRLYSERGPGVARKVKGMLRGAARWAADEDHLDRDVLEGLRYKEAEPKVRDRVLDDRELVELWQASLDAPLVIGGTVRLQLVMGLRHPSETTTMLWTDLKESVVDGVGKVLVYDMPGARRKHGIPHALALPPLAVEVIEALRAANGSKVLVFDGWTRGRELHWWRNRLRRNMLAAGSKPLCRHDLRRSTASGMVRIGVPAHQAGSVLGHKLTGTAKHYIHGAQLVATSSALWQWDRHIQKLLGRAVPDVVPFRARA